MKLRHALAGTVALPLALAVASSANAATIVDNAEHQLNIGGYVAAQAAWQMPDVGDNDFGMGLGLSRLNFKYTAKTDAGNVTALYENDYLNGAYRLRHAAIMHDGWVAGQTWSFFANLNGLGETIDIFGNSGASSWANRNALLGKNINLADGMSVGVSIEDRNQTTIASAAPDLTANFKGNFGGIGVFAAVQSYQIQDPDDATSATGEMRMTASASVPVGDTVNVKAAYGMDGDDMAVSAAAQVKLSDQVRTNLMFEQTMNDADNTDSTSIWINAFYKMPSGFEWGGEVQMVSADTGGSVNAYDNSMAVSTMADGDMAVRLQAKYAF